MPSLEKMAKAARAKPKAAAKPAKTAVKKAAKPMIEAFKSSEFINSSDEEEDAESSEEEEVPAVKTVPMLKPQVVEEESSSEEESGSRSEEESSSEEDGDEMELDAPVPLPASILKKTPSEPSKPKPKPRAAQETPLPPNFKPLPLPSTTEPTAASTLFQRSNLEGIQIWYFTAPSTIPFSAISGRLSLKEGNTLTHDGNAYTFSAGTVPTGTKLLLPTSKDGGYKSSSKPITKTYNLQLLPQLPGVTLPGPSPTATIPAPKPVRPQPKGMRMRFYPIGVIPSPPHPDLHSESEVEEAQLHTLSAEGLDSDVEMGGNYSALAIASKRKAAANGNGEEKRSKKRKITAAEGDSQIPTSSITKESRKKSGKFNGVEEETKAEKEERRRKKKEKKVRKAGSVEA